MVFSRTKRIPPKLSYLPHLKMKKVEEERIRGPIRVAPETDSNLWFFKKRKKGDHLGRLMPIVVLLFWWALFSHRSGLPADATAARHLIQILTEPKSAFNEAPPRFPNSEN